MENTDNKPADGPSDDHGVSHRPTQPANNAEHHHPSANHALTETQVVDMGEVR